MTPVMTHCRLSTLLNCFYARKVLFRDFYRVNGALRLLVRRCSGARRRPRDELALIRALFTRSILNLQPTPPQEKVSLTSSNTVTSPDLIRCFILRTKSACAVNLLSLHAELIPCKTLS